jgi:hypothetical protein
LKSVEICLTYAPGTMPGRKNLDCKLNYISAVASLLLRIRPDCKIAVTTRIACQYANNLFTRKWNNFFVREIMQ